MIDMTENTTAPVVVHARTATYRARGMARVGGYGVIVDRLLANPAEYGITDEGDDRNWDAIHHGAQVYASEQAAVEAGAQWIRRTLGEQGLTLEWVQQSLFPRLIELARFLGVDASCWSMDQRVGFGWRIIEHTPSGPRQIGPGNDHTWWETAGRIQGMIDMCVEMQRARDDSERGR
ncbi:hypothetical protein [Kutzneria sp. 744]|uniref:hypothetical protein n=1 Tax=Kutzneria sp. (strain 744) TaxID=345341 RepID=UPI0003EECACD|nr:hypothetical protein [Kutzneria sp. 744]EWM19638.1 hypothetical protein KUTG_09942 [Kutzneria sp. 744]